jgi:hypothetical protein
MANWTTRITLAVAIALGAMGCGRRAVSQQQTSADDKPESTAIVPASEVGEKATPKTSARSSRLPQDAKPAVTPTVEKYVGPFPHRSNPFALPNADSAATAAKQRETVKQAEERLLGFINVDGRKALIQIDGKVWAAQQGDRRDGIEVVEIAPAKVTLRRDGATWQLSLLQQDHSG